MPRARARHAAPSSGARAGFFPLVLGVLGVAALGAAAVTLARRDATVGDVAAADTGGPATTAPATTTPPEPTTAPPTTRHPVLGSGETITLAFAGDTNFEGSAAARLDADPASVLAAMAPVLSAADLTVVNMETAIGTGGTPVPKEFTFQAPPIALEAFRAAGVDVVSAANNHGMDFGVDGLHETLAAEQAFGLPIIGIGADEAEAYAPFVADVRGQRVAVIAATQVLDNALIEEWTATPDRPGLASAKRVDRLVQAVAEARASSDTVVVFLHWGVERETCPTARQEELADALVAAGADVVVGGHAHRLQGGGRLGAAVVHYGLGNFGFNAGTTAAARTGVLVVRITGRQVEGYEWVPGRVVDRQPVPLEGAERDAAVAHWDGLRSCTNLTA